MGGEAPQFTFLATPLYLLQYIDIDSNQQQQQQQQDANTSLSRSSSCPDRCLVT